ncbi:MAG TPA: hypothetical protein VFB45_13385 [Pseudolabrys sp.]|nr:hypothetical protein [Pseudolabrys sp.]
MFRQSMPPALSALVISCVLAVSAAAHEIVGNRFFPATLAVDDPGVNDEAAITLSATKLNGDDPSSAFRQLDIQGEFSKRITEDFGISIGPIWSRLSAPGGPLGTGASGFQNLETTFKYRLYKNIEHEFVMSAGLSIEWGGSGAQGVGAERFSHYVPTFYFGKGFGDLPDSLSFARPLAITGVVGYSVPATTAHMILDPASGQPTGDTEFHARVLQWGATLQYSMPYLKSAVVDLQLPDFINHLIPIVEASFQTPVANTLTSGTVMTGTVNPGLIYVGRTYQVGVEAMIPINPQSGANVGVLAQLHLYLDDLFPRSIGRPLFADRTATATGRPTFGP